MAAIRRVKVEVSWTDAGIYREQRVVQVTIDPEPYASPTMLKALVSAFAFLRPLVRRLAKANGRLLADEMDATKWRDAAVDFTAAAHSYALAVIANTANAGALAHLQAAQTAFAATAAALIDGGFAADRLGRRLLYESVRASTRLNDAAPALRTIPPNVDDWSTVSRELYFIQLTSVDYLRLTRFDPVERLQDPRGRARLGARPFVVTNRYLAAAAAAPSPFSSEGGRVIGVRFTFLLDPGLPRSASEENRLLSLLRS